MPAPVPKAWHPKSVTIRRMLPSDALATRLLLKESPEASMWSMESLEESASRWIAWVAEGDRRVVGFLVGRPAADEFEILNLAVGTEFRRKGIASQLIQTAIETARFAGVANIFLEVRASNEAGIALYTRLAFQACGRRKNYYRDPIEDAVLLIFNNFETVP
jgi:[ribosomal protein S18]-alanine N-acetyltransferase